MVVDEMRAVYSYYVVIHASLMTERIARNTHASLPMRFPAYHKRPRDSGKGYTHTHKCTAADILPPPYLKILYSNRINTGYRLWKCDSPPIKLYQGICRLHSDVRSNASFLISLQSLKTGGIDCGGLTLTRHVLSRKNGHGVSKGLCGRVFTGEGLLTSMLFPRGILAPWDSWPGMFRLRCGSLQNGCGG